MDLFGIVSFFVLILLSVSLIVFIKRFNRKAEKEEAKAIYEKTIIDYDILKTGSIIGKGDKVVNIADYSWNEIPDAWVNLPVRESTENDMRNIIIVRRKSVTVSAI
jgi:hypothetical protein